MRKDRLQFSLRIIIPSLLALVIMALVLSAVVLPSLRDSLLERKKETILELTSTVEALLMEWHREVEAGALSRAEAQAQAIERVRDLRYGAEGKDYFWLTTLEPRMIMHPYLPQLEGDDLTEFRDPDGKALFVESVRVVEGDGEGFVNYRWQWKDDETRIVPKLSHVRRFEPWGWIIGTGVYIEDVRAEISTMTRQAVQASILLIALVTAIMIFVARQSYHLELKRRAAEAALLESKLRYQTLVESSEEGFVLILDGAHVYSNAVIQRRLGYSDADLEGLDLQALLRRFCGEGLGDIDAEALEAPRRHEVYLEGRDGARVHAQVTLSPIQIGARAGLALILRDVSEARHARAQLDDHEARWGEIAESLPLGLFALQLEPSPELKSRNPACARILKLPEGEEGAPLSLKALLVHPDDLKRLLISLRRGEAVRDRLLHVRRLDGLERTMSFTLLPRGKGAFDGIMEDLTEQEASERQRQDLIEEAQSSLLLLNRPLKEACGEIPRVPLATPIAEVARRMTREGASVALVIDPEEQGIGVVSDHDMRGRVLAEGLDPSLPISRVMTAPIVGLDENSQIFEAAVEMQSRGVQHLMLWDKQRRIRGAFSASDLLALQRDSSAILVLQMRQAVDLQELRAHHARLRRMIRALVRGGAGAVAISRMLSAAHDTALQRVVDFTLERLGPPPAPFSYLVFGSGGRREMTLHTDQDNALLWADEEGLDDDEAEARHEWFNRLGREVSRQLEALGYVLCLGGNMASNPRWCMPLSAWKALFEGWISNPDAQEVISLQIFFDFRSAAGEASLVGALRGHILEQLEHRPAFFWNLAQDCMKYRPPLDLFGNLKGQAPSSRDRISLKDALKPLVGFARLRALEHGLAETGTLSRLRRLHERGLLSAGTSRTSSQAFELLTQMRLRRQEEQIARGEAVDNQVRVQALSDFERELLKRVFEQVHSIQSQLGREYKGLG